MKIVKQRKEPSVQKKKAPIYKIQERKFKESTLKEVCKEEAEYTHTPKINKYK